MAADDDVDAWVLASVPGRLGTGGRAQAAIPGMLTWGIVSNTDKRDVSEILDLLARDETPFLNRISWGPETSAVSIEWISEDLGPGYVVNKSVIVSAAGGGASMLLLSIDGITGSDLVRQLHEGTILYHFGSTVGYHGIFAVTSEPGMIAPTEATVHLSQLEFGTVYGTGIGSINVGCEFYILGNAQNEGSTPGVGRPRDRVLCSNTMTILRQDVNITGSMMKTDMHAIGPEDRHQIMMRMRELQRERERMALYSVYFAKTSLQAGLMNGVMGFLNDQSGNHIDRTTRSLTSSSVETVVRRIWEHGGRNLTLFGSINQVAKFTRWDKNRIRTTYREGLGGGYINHYLTEAGIELELVPMANVPDNLMFIVDPSQIRMRAKKGRKAIMERLGKEGDFERWQMLSEFTMEMRGYNQGKHGMLAHLAN